MILQKLIGLRVVEPIKVFCRIKIRFVNRNSCIQLWYIKGQFNYAIRKVRNKSGIVVSTALRYDVITRSFRTEIFVLMGTLVCSTTYLPDFIGRFIFYPSVNISISSLKKKIWSRVLSLMCA